MVCCDVTGPPRSQPGGCAIGQMGAPEDGGTGPILTEAAARMSKKMETFGVVQPPCVYAEGPSISLHLIKNPEVFPYAKTSRWKGVGERGEC